MAVTPYAPPLWRPALYALFTPLPLGCFTAALICDTRYLFSYQPFWTQAASWLIVFALLLAATPRLMSLGQVWPGRAVQHSVVQRRRFWLNALVRGLAIIHAFIHSRDARAVVPAGVVLSTLTVVALRIAHLDVATAARHR
ncbi:DUF2231 domain-containing protein [Pantoea sp. 1.19]|uniref:DUF2231 domain-containing protein n=1 Tax=Pantoea sp. 1.19 TaxID=1925589 RepID=UPI000948C1E7|nr:DUF2231 domain-containing protein [Pantoea sp. 1.19]